MNLLELLERLRVADITLQTDGQQIVYDAAFGALTEDLRTAIRAHKPELVAVLAAPGAALVSLPEMDCPYIPGRQHVEQNGRLICVGPDDQHRWPHSCADSPPEYRQAMRDAMAAYRAAAP